MTTHTSHSSNNRKPRRSAALAIAAGVIGGAAIGLAGTVPGFASAAAPDTTISAPADEGDNTADDSADTDAGSDADQGNADQGRRGERGPKGDLDGLASVLGVADADALRAEFEAGKTPAEIAEANGVDLDTVRDYLKTQMQERVDAAVADGRIDQATADEKLADADERIEARLNGERPEGGHAGRGGKGISDEFAAVLGVADGDALRAEFEAGKTPAEIAEANGVDLDTVRDYLKTQMQERVDAAVADGRIDQATADEKLADADERIESMLNGERPEGGRRNARGASQGADTSNSSSASGNAGTAASV